MLVLGAATLELTRSDDATRCFVLRPSGAVVTREVVEKIIRKEMIDPISGTKLAGSDLIEVRVGCGGFADGRSVLTASRVAPVMPS
ncbi:nitric oxide synthase interacting protein [Echinococcus multilocularis]|uniref:Nitric oxide synthase interacting protein n=1 Tax=Echinococcus multilocularis TaxID=6211 RepID=A0A068Y937_ECHMU|nr:nitric oxide synthase interacting protein [Echinococcus multilocularis]